MEFLQKRRKGAELLSEQRSAIYYAFLLGQTQTKLANDFRCTCKTIYNIIKRIE
jgi:Mor family transcriptional regulator